MSILPKKNKKKRDSKEPIKVFTLNYFIYSSYVLIAQLASIF